VVGVTSAMPPGATAETPIVVQNRGGAQRAIGWFLVGAGVAGLAIGAYFTTQWADKRSDADAHCVGDVCDPTGTQLRHDATGQGRGAIIAGGSGLVAILLGGALVATAPSPRLIATPSGRLDAPSSSRSDVASAGLRSNDAPAARSKVVLAPRFDVTPIVGPGLGGLSVRGAF
jgi:hypothetical protein